MALHEIILANLRGIASASAPTGIVTDNSTGAVRRRGGRDSMIDERLEARACETLPSPTDRGIASSGTAADTSTVRSG
jgi:hypothetical protein